VIAVTVAIVLTIWQSSGYPAGPSIVLLGIGHGDPGQSFATIAPDGSTYLIQPAPRSLVRLTRFMPNGSVVWSHTYRSKANAGPYFPATATSSDVLVANLQTSFTFVSLDTTGRIVYTKRVRPSAYGGNGIAIRDSRGSVYLIDQITGRIATNGAHLTTAIASELNKQGRVIRRTRFSVDSHDTIDSVVVMPDRSMFVLCSSVWYSEASRAPGPLVLRRFDSSGHQTWARWVRPSLQAAPPFSTSGSLAVEPNGASLIVSAGSSGELYATTTSPAGRPGWAREYGVEGGGFGVPPQALWSGNRSWLVIGMSAGGLAGEGNGNSSDSNPYKTYVLKMSAATGQIQWLSSIAPASRDGLAPGFAVLNQGRLRITEDMGFGDSKPYSGPASAVIAAMRVR
jgi:hypothetical protein